MRGEGGSCHARQTVILSAASISVAEVTLFANNLRTDQQSQRPRSEVCKVKAPFGCLELRTLSPDSGLLSLKFGRKWREIDIKKNSYYSLQFSDSQAPTSKS